MDRTEVLRIGMALQRSVTSVRQRLDDPNAAVVIVSPMLANAHLARRQLALSGSFLRVYFTTPRQLVADYGRRTLAERGLRSQTSAWLHATLQGVLPELAEADRLLRWADTLQRSTWLSTIANAVQSAEAALLVPTDLRGRGDRAECLANIMQAVDARRERDGVYGDREMYTAAMEAIETGQDNAWNRMHGCVLLGDGVLPYGAHGALRAWLSTRTTSRVGLVPFEHLAPAPLGLRDAGGPAVELITADLPTGASLRHICENWHGPSEPAPSLDESVTLAATPDEIRETHEVVREVLAAIRRGVALDRIAIAVPDSSNADVLKHALDRAGIPATMQIGPPIARTGEAQFLRLVLGLANGDDTIASWYDLLRHPGILKRGVFRASAPRGKGRWRRILARCGAVRGTETILAALEHFSNRSREEERLDDEAAADSLRTSIAAMHERLEALPKFAPPGDHADAWRVLLRDHCRYSHERGVIEQLLGGWGPPGLGPNISRRAAFSMLVDELTSTESHSGSLTDTAVLVAPPMALFGGEFDLVCVLAMTQGSLPRKYEEDVFITDEFVHAINDSLGERLVDSRTLEAAETRRFAAAVSAASDRLWLSIPRTEMVEGRPTLPSSFVLDILSALHGRRVRYAEVADLTVRRGTRTGVGCEDPSQAINPTEHILARIASDKTGVFPKLATHATARRLFQLRRSIDRLRHDPDALPDAWSGRIEPDRLETPLLDGTPDLGFRFERAVRDPGRYLFVNVLGASPPPNLHPRADFLSKWAVARRVCDALAEIATLPTEQMREALSERLSVDVADELRFLPEAVAAQRDEIVEASLAVFDELIEKNPDGLVSGSRLSEEESGLIDALGWSVKPGDRFVGEGVCASLETAAGLKNIKADRHFASLLTALAARANGHQVDHIRVVGLDHSIQGPLDKFVDEVVADARVGRRRAQVGYWPLGEPKKRRYTLEAEKPLSKEQHHELLERLESMSAPGGDQ